MRFVIKTADSAHMGILPSVLQDLLLHVTHMGLVNVMYKLMYDCGLWHMPVYGWRSARGCPSNMCSCDWSHNLWPSKTVRNCVTQWLWQKIPPWLHFFCSPHLLYTGPQSPVTALSTVHAYWSDHPLAYMEATIPNFLDGTGWDGMIPENTHT